MPAGRSGIPATSPRKTHRKLKADSAPGLDYRAYLARRQSAVLGHVRGAAPRVLYAYRYALSGFAAVMSPAQAAQLAKQPDVASVEPAEDEHVMDDPDTLLGGAFGEPAAYLRLTDPDPATGLWARLGGPVAANGAGAGMIVGDIDTGIEPGHPSFAADGQGYLGDPYGLPAVWNGACQAGPGFAVLGLQPQADRRALLRRRVRPDERRAGLVPVAARRRRARHPHRLDGRRQLRRARPDRRQRLRHPRHLGHRPARVRGRVQGLLERQRHGRRPAATARTSSRRSTRPWPTAST